jgi:NodT family efflux transporter outer membrane factor (OMF) lipoprotein
MLALAGCAAVGPNFSEPRPPAAPGYLAVGDKPWQGAAPTPEAGPAGPWWKAFGSPALDQVMAQALAGNQTLAAAEATLQKLQAQAQRERAALSPQVQGAASYQRERINTSAFGFAGFPSPTINFFNIGPSVSYDLDLAGGGRRRVEAARAQADAQARRADAAYLTLTGNVALEAVRIAALQAAVDTIQGVIADDRQTIEISEQAEAAGGQARSVGLGGKLLLQQDLALLPPLFAQLSEARHALALLVGEAPSQWSPPNFTVESLHAPATIPVAIPSALVERRPDIQAAEADLHADTAMIGVQTARLYPDVRLVAGLSQEGLTPGSLFGFGATAYNFGPAATVPIFDGGQIRADRRAAQAQARASLARYRQTVVAAFVQVSDVLSALAQDDDRLANLTRAETTAKASLDETRAAYDLGGASLVSVVVAERVWRRASLDKVQVLGQRLQDIVSLYGATAADWRTVSNSTASGRTPGKP